MTCEKKPAVVMERGRGKKKEQRAGSMCNGRDGEIECVREKIKELQRSESRR